MNPSQQGQLNSGHSHDPCITAVKASIAQHLMDRYGPLLDSKSMAAALKFSSVGALDKSLARGNLPIRTLKFSHRRGTFALAHELARYLAEQGETEGPQAEDMAPGERGAKA